jgi:hypothetical protein
MLAHVLWVSLCCCGHPPAPPLLDQIIREAPQTRLAHPEEERRGRRQRVVARARELVAGATFAAGGLEFPPDPVGFARAAYWAAEIDLFDASVAADPEAHGVEILFRSAAARHHLHKHTPRPGDLTFFDPSPRGKALYPAQVAVVEEVLDDGSLLLLGVFSGGPARVTMNLRTPNTTKRPSGVVVNDLAGDKEPVPLARLFRSFADPF